MEPYQNFTYAKTGLRVTETLKPLHHDKVTVSSERKTSTVPLGMCYLKGFRVEKCHGKITSALGYVLPKRTQSSLMAKLPVPLGMCYLKGHRAV